MGWFEKLSERLTCLRKSVGVRKKPEGHVAFDRHLDSGKVIHIPQKGIVHPKIRKPRVKKLAYVEPTEAPAKRKIELLAGNAHEVGTKRNIGGDKTKQKKIDALSAKVKENVKAGKLLKVGDQVNFSVDGDSYRKFGTIKEVTDKHYHVVGKKLETGKIPTYTLMHDAVIPQQDYKNAFTTNLQGKEAVSSGKGATAQLSTDELNRRREDAEKRVYALFEGRIAEHPSFTGPAFKIVSEIAKMNGISTEVDPKRGGWNQAVDPDYQDLLSVYYFGSLKAWRRLLSETPGRLTAQEISDNINDFKEVLTGHRRTSYISNQMQVEGRNAAIAHAKKLQYQRNNSISHEDLEDPEHPGNKRYLEKIASKPRQLIDYLNRYGQRLKYDYRKAIGLLTPPERTAFEMKLGVTGNFRLPKDQPFPTHEQIADRLNKQNGNTSWDAEKVKSAILSAEQKIRDNREVSDSLGFEYDVLLGRDVSKSDKELVADLKKSYPDAIVAVNKLGVCVMLTDDLKKSFSSDLATSHPSGRWMTVKGGPLKGRNLYILQTAPMRRAA